NQLAAVFKAISDGVVVYDRQGEVMQRNPAARTLLDVDRMRAAQVANRGEEGVPPERLALARALDGETVDGSENVEFVVPRYGGQDRQINLSVAPIWDSDGIIAGAVAISRDVTARRQRERRTHDTLDAVLKMTEALVTNGASTLASGEAELVSAQSIAHHLLELLRGVLAQPVAALLSIEQHTHALQPLAVAGLSNDAELQWRATVVHSRLNEHLSAADAARLAAGNVALVHHQRDSKPDLLAQPDADTVAGSTLIVPVRVGRQLAAIMELEYGGGRHVFTPDELALAGAVARLAALAIEREQIVLENESVVRSFYESEPMLMGIAQIVDDDLRYLSCNRALAERFGKTPEAMRGETARVLGMPDRQVDTGLHFGRLAERTAAPVRFEYEAETPEGVRYMAATCCPIKNSSGPYLRFSFIVDDITNQKQIQERMRQFSEAALEASRLKSEFLANMSHEIRTPLNGVLGMTELLLGTTLDDAQRSYASIARASGKSLLGIINDILDFSKVEAGRMELETIELDARSVVEEVGDVLIPKVREKKLEPVTFVAPELDVPLLGDPSRLRQVLLNLAANAVKFTERGEVAIWALPQEITETRVTVRFEVVDTGIGLSPAARERIFQPFTQGEGSTSRRYGGTGLGLSICKRLVELMGGVIGVTGEEGFGSTFWFTIPFARAPITSAMLIAPARLDGMRALVVDDSPTNQSILERYLGHWGARAARVQSGNEAFEALRRATSQGEPFDTVLIDVALPDVDGFALARAIRADPQLDTARLILLTAFGEQHQVRRAREAGFAAHLTKPVKGEQLRRALARLLTAKDGDTFINESGPILLDVDSHGLTETGSLPRPHALHSGLILLAEDNEINQKLAHWQLQRLGYSCHVVASGREALEALATRDYELVLMDCQMPEMDGYEATRAIRANEAGSGKHVPVVAMTANAMQGDRAACIAAGMDDYVTKPVQVEELHAMMERWMPTENVSAEATPAPRRPTPQQTPVEPAVTAVPPLAAARPSAEERPAVLGRPEPVSSVPLARVDGEEMPASLDTDMWACFLESADPDEPNILDELLRDFLSKTPEEIQAMRQSLARGDDATLRRQAHSLVSGSFALGAMRFSRLCSDLEMAADDGDLAAAHTLLMRAAAEFIKVYRAIQEARRALGV
ncbi:MAG: response regulator, partial [Ktedonobacterales bacterium]